MFVALTSVGWLLQKRAVICWCVGCRCRRVGCGGGNGAILNDLWHLWLVVLCDFSPFFFFFFFSIANDLQWGCADVLINFIYRTYICTYVHTNVYHMTVILPFNVIWMTYADKPICTRIVCTSDIYLLFTYRWYWNMSARLGDKTFLRWFVWANENLSWHAVWQLEKYTLALY